MEEVLIQRTVKTTIQILYDKCLFDSYDKAVKVLKDFLFTRRRPGLEESKGCHSMTLFINTN